MENNYKPEKIINTTLENSEIHFCSFAVMPYSKDIFGHSPNLDTYTMHLTDKRLIIEPDINTEFLEKFYKVINLIPLEGAGVHLAKSMNKEAIKRMNYLKYTSISISYKEIEGFKSLSASFNTHLVQILLKNDLGGRNLTVFKDLGLELFKPTPVREINFNKAWGKISKAGLIRMSIEFLESVNEMKKTDCTSDFIAQAGFLLALDQITTN